MPAEAELTPQQKFEEKIKESIRDKIGELLPDEALAEIVQKGIKQAFTDPKVTTIHSGYSSQIKTEEPWLVTHLREFAKERVREWADKWIVEHPEEFKKSVDAVLKKNAFEMLSTAFSAILAEPFEKMQQQLWDLNKMIVKPNY